MIRNLAAPSTLCSTDESARKEVELERRMAIRDN
jgi:hypothetical protein